MTSEIILIVIVAGGCCGIALCCMENDCYYEVYNENETETEKENNKPSDINIETTSPINNV
jgi:hypothetical protein